MNSNNIAMPAIRSAASVLYSPAITVDRAIGLRNDPHRAAIIAQAKEREEQLWQAAQQLPPYERRDFEQWLESTAGQAFVQWSKRALVMAGALELIETAWEEDPEADAGEDEVDPLTTRLADAAWWFDNHGMWFLGGAFLVAFVAFFAVGPASGPIINAVKLAAWMIAAVLVLIHLMGRALPALLRWRCRQLNREVPRAAAAKAPTAPLWGEDSPVTSARILNHINWVMLAQPDPQHLLDLRPPSCPYDDLNTGGLNPKQVQIAQTLRRTEQRSAKKPPSGRPGGLNQRKPQRPEGPTNG